MPRRMKYVVLVGSVVLVAAFALLRRTEVRASQTAVPPAQASERLGPGPEPVDRWHPRRSDSAAPAYGGTIRVHIESLPPSLNGMLLNNQNARNMHFELHASLVKRDWESWELEPELATS